MVVNIRVPFWVLIIIRHRIFRVPKKGTLSLTTIHIGDRVLRIRVQGFEVRRAFGQSLLPRPVPQCIP